MPFTPYKSAFNPETLRAMQEAFEMAWSEVVDLPIVNSDPQSARELLAQRIVLAAQEDSQRSTDQLKVQALRAFER